MKESIKTLLKICGMIGISIVISAIIVLVASFFGGI
jgi:hypothetical protein